MSSGFKGRKQKRSIGFRFAWNGIVEVIKTERNFRFHLLAGGLALIAGVVLGLSSVEWAVIVTIISVVLAVEMLNSSIERLLDYLAPEEHPLAGLVKDIAAGAVLVVSFASVIIALFIFIPKLI